MVLRNIFFFFFRKGVYPYEYIDDWEMFHETILPEKKNSFIVTWIWNK